MSPSMRQWMALAVVCVLAPAVHAETLYKCVDKTGLTTIQQDPCGKGQTQAWARASQPEPPPTPEQLAAMQARREAQAQQEAREAEQRQKEEAEARERAAALPLPPLPPAPPPPETAPDGTPAPPPNEAEAACNEARAFGIAARAKPWLELNSTQQQRLYAWVVQQCKGVRPKLPGRR